MLIISTSFALHTNICLQVVQSNSAWVWEAYLIFSGGALWGERQRSVWVKILNRFSVVMHRSRRASAFARLLVSECNKHYWTHPGCCRRTGGSGIQVLFEAWRGRWFNSELKTMQRRINETCCESCMMNNTGSSSTTHKVFACMCCGWGPLWKLIILSLIESKTSLQSMQLHKNDLLQTFNDLLTELFPPQGYVSI